MGRPREFDEEEVVDRALAAFWRKGYEATSVSDLMEATGLAKGSVYKGFGDKRSFFLRVLTEYLEAGRARYRRHDGAGADAIATLRAWMLGGVSCGTEDTPPSGCFAVNTAVELAERDAEIRALLQSHERALQALYRATLRRGQAAGQIRGDLDLMHTARWLTALIAGLRVGAKTGLSDTEAESLVDFSLAAVKQTT